MKVDMKSIAVVGFMIFLAQSCSEKKTFAQMIKENPDAIIKSIEKHPAKYMLALQKASLESRDQMAKIRRIERERKIASYFDKPLKPLINEHSVRGNKEAPITLVQYTDFECPYCKIGSQTVNALRKRYGKDIKVVYKNMPLDSHANAKLAARYFEAIKKQDKDKAFKFNDEIFKNQRKFIKGGEEYLKKASKIVGVNMKKLSLDIVSKEVQQRIENDLAEAKKFEFAGTPGFLINGIPVKGALPESHFVQLVEQLKKRKIIQM